MIGVLLLGFVFGAVIGALAMALWYATRPERKAEAAALPSPPGDDDDEEAGPQLYGWERSVSAMRKRQSENQ